MKNKEIIKKLQDTLSKERIKIENYENDFKSYAKSQSKPLFAVGQTITCEIENSGVISVIILSNRDELGRYDIYRPDNKTKYTDVFECDLQNQLWEKEQPK